MSRFTFGMLILPSRMDERQDDKPEFVCINCGRPIYRRDGGARWTQGPGLWLVDDEGAEHVDKDLCAKNRASDPSNSL